MFELTNIKVVLVGFREASWGRRVSVAAFSPCGDGGQCVNLIFSQIQGERPVYQLQSSAQQSCVIPPPFPRRDSVSPHLHRSQLLKEGRLLCLEVELRSPHLELLYGSLGRKQSSWMKVMGFLSNRDAWSSSELTKDPRRLKVAVWDVRLNAGRGGLMQAEWSWVWERNSRVTFCLSGYCSSISNFISLTPPAMFNFLF